MISCYLNKIFFFIFLVLLTGCRLNDNSIRGSSGSDSTPSTTPISHLPISINISVNKPLINSALENSLNKTDGASLLTRTNSNQVPANISPNAVDNSQLASNGGTVLLDPVTPITLNTNSLEELDAVNGFDILVQVMAVPQLIKYLACFLTQPFTNISCSQEGFTINSKDLQTGDIQLNLQENNKTVSSTSLSSLKFSIRQFAKMGNDTDFEFWNPEVILNNQLYLRFDNGSIDRRLMRYDATSDTLTTLIDYTNSSFHHSSQNFLAYNNKIFSSSYYSAPYDKLHVYDSTANTFEVISNTSNNLSCRDRIKEKVIYNNQLFFIAVNSNSCAGPFYYKIYSYDESSNVLSQKVNLNGSNVDDEFSSLTVYNNQLYFTAANSSGANKLFSYDDTTNTVYSISDIQNNQIQDDFPLPLKLYNNKMFLQALSPSGGTKLYKYNAGDKTMNIVTNIRNDLSLDDIPNIMSNYNIIYNNKLFFNAYVNHLSDKLFSYDDSTNILTRISNLRNDDSLADNIKYLTIYQNKLFFFANNSDGYTKLFSYDDTTQMLQQVSNTAGNNAHDDPNSLTVYNDRLYFASKNTNSMTKLYTYDGSLNKILLISDFQQNNMADDGIYISNLIYGNRLFIKARNPQNNYKLWVLCDPTSGCTP